ncbi:kinase-like domain-containing protein [Mycena galericulata]|nr:kinase-like domain-containing protein [Mycena galericulata]
MSLEASLRVVLAEVPVPGLSTAFSVFKFIVSSVQAVKESKKQLQVLAKGIGELLSTLNAEFRGSRIVTANCVKPLADLENLLQDIHRFVQKERDKAFLKSLLNKDSRINQIESFYRRIGLTVSAFHISGLLSMQDMLRNNETARIEDAGMLNACLRSLEQNQDDLRHELDINHNNMLAMMASLQRRLNVVPNNDQEQNFYSHTLQYLTSMSGQQVQSEDWMVSSFDIDYGPEIGVGGFGKVYLGTWNKTEVAIKVLQNVAGVTPSVALLRKEIDIWLTLRHPNILQFLGANTLDDSPFLVMPYIQYNARQFLEQQPSFDPVYILHDVSLALQYLHSRKICHGDLKGANILVEPSGRALLCDFGLSRIKADATSRTAHTANNTVAGSRNWMAPELLAGSPPKMPSDIYAFGMTLFELYSGETPLVNIEHSDFIKLVFQLGVRPDQPEIEDVPKLTDSLWNLAERCWLQDPKARPTAGQIHAVVVDIISEISMDSHGEVMNSPRGTKIHNPNHNLPDNSVSLNKDLLDKLSSMSELASAHHQAGRFKEAEQLRLENFEKQKQVLGEDHPDTLKSMSKLAATYSKLGKWREAEDLEVELIKKRRQVLGADHPKTLQSMNNLAVTYSKLGKLKEAEELNVEVTKKQKQVLGEDHPDTLNSMHNLAFIYSKLGNWKEAEELQVEVLKKQKQVLGVDHRDTLRSMDYLVSTYKELGKHEDAKALSKTIKDIRKRAQASTS